MNSYDFNIDLQKIFDFKFSKSKHINWRKWLDISSNEEYESLALKLSGLSDIDNLFERLKTEVTKPKQVKVNKDSFLNSFDKSNLIFLCHTSGTSGSKISDLKWIHMSDEFVQTVWVPGMQAIFEASGLNSKSSAIIFVPSRTLMNGLKIDKNRKIISLYSSEFSQRLMLSLIKPRQYLIDQYKNSKNLLVIEKILTMDKISVISAPASTILTWANVEKFGRGIKRFLATNFKNDEIKNSKLFKKIENQGLTATIKDIQNEFSKKFSECTLVFSISSLTEHEWEQIRNFMKWEKHAENFTNLYVGSEIGPFSASIRLSTSEISPKDRMFVFPLHIPVIMKNREAHLLSRTKDIIGELFISRISQADPLINIQTGDIISIKGQDGLPQIGGDILRAAFRLKKKISIIPKYNFAENYTIFVGDYFNLENIEIINPRRLFACLAEKCDFKRDSVMIFKSQDTDQQWNMLIPIKNNDKNSKLNDIFENLIFCPSGNNLINAITKKLLHLEIVDNIPLKSEKSNSELLEQVSKGIMPKGILKKWPLYVIIPNKKKNLNS